MRVAIFDSGSRRGSNLLWTSELFASKSAAVEPFFPIGSRSFDFVGRGLVVACSQPRAPALPWGECPRGERSLAGIARSARVAGCGMWAGEFPEVLQSCAHVGGLDFVTISLPEDLQNSKAS